MFAWLARFHRDTVGTATANYGYCKLPMLQTADDETGDPTVGRQRVLSDLTLIPDLFTLQKRLQIDRVTRRGQQAVTNWNIHCHGYTCAFAWALVAAWGTLRVYPWIQAMRALQPNRQR